MRYSAPPYHSYNPYFLVPFIIWVVTGGILQLMYDPETLFRAVNTRHTIWLDTAMYYITMLGEAYIGIILLLLLFVFPAFRNWWYFVAALLSHLVPAVLVTQTLKGVVGASRPLRYYSETGWIHHLPAWPQLMERSFPSGHTCFAFSLFAFLSCFLPHKHHWLGMVFFLLAVLTGYSRLYLAAHFFTDVYAGSIIAVVFVILVLAFMRRHAGFFFKKNNNDTALTENN